VPEIFRSLFASQNFDRCHSFLLPSSATGGGRKRPHFDTSPYLIVFEFCTAFARPSEKCCHPKFKKIEAFAR